jgi:hypothetical protein
MDSEVDPRVLVFINEKRLQGEKRSPVEIISRMGVFEARDKASESAWLATGGNIITTIWAEFVSVSASGRWFCAESLDVQHRLGGAAGERSAQQVQRATDRLALLKRSLDPGIVLRAVLQTNRVPMVEAETNRAARVSTRVPDEQEWHVALWEPDLKLAVLVRGARDWLPSEDDLQAARRRSGAPLPQAPIGDMAPGQLQAAAMDHLTRHFAGYGYKPENVADQKLGYDLEVKDKKGATLLKLAVKGTMPNALAFELTSEERACAARGDPWRLAVVSDAAAPAPQHKLYKPAELGSVSGLEQTP